MTDLEAGPEVVVLPGVYAPRADSALLVAALQGAGVRRGARVLDLCAGTGVLALAAAAAGGRVTAVDVAPDAVENVRLNAARAGVAVDGRCGDLFGPVAGERFDLVLSNPPYLPTPAAPAPRPAPDPLAQAWNAGIDGRAVLDRICHEVADHLEPGGGVLLVQSAFAGIARTVHLLAAEGLDVARPESHPGVLGPIAEARREHLVDIGVLAPRGVTEDLVVIRARVPLRLDRLGRATVLGPGAGQRSRSTLPVIKPASSEQR